MENLKINNAMNYRYENPGTNLKVDTLIAETALKTITDPTIISDMELFASLSSESKSSLLLQQHLTNLKEQNLEINGLTR